MQGAHLGHAQFDAHTDLSPDSLRGAALCFVDLRHFLDIKDYFHGLFGDASVLVPDDHGPHTDSWPPHWPKFRLGDKQFEEEWRKWQADPANYVPPEAPEKE